HRETLRVRYSDTDAQGIAHHSSYLLWLEEARLGWLRAIDLGYADLTAGGLFLSLVECSCRYISPALGEDVVTVDVWVGEISRLRVRLRYEIRRDDTLLATAATQNAFVDGDGRPRRLPADHPAWDKLREL
ncbi:MAG: thioesterase family protein, partial [Chloroflexi bacterium]|nr:thioesterase family protein [Chloroflexota bacterium]